MYHAVRTELHMTSLIHAANVMCIHSRDASSWQFHQQFQDNQWPSFSELLWEHTETLLMQLGLKSPKDSSGMWRPQETCFGVWNMQ